MCPFLLSPACSHLELKLLALYCVSNVDTPLYVFFFSLANFESAEGEQELSSSMRWSTLSGCLQCAVLV